MRRDVRSMDVNEYLKEVCGSEFTAKDFRTWAATVLAIAALREVGCSASTRQAKEQARRAIDAVAAMLGNTPAVCRKSYIHPAIVDCYMDGVTLSAAAHRVQAAASKKAPAALSPDETAVVGLIARRLLKTA